MVTMDWVVSRFRFKGPSWYLIFTHITTHFIGTTPRLMWRPNLRCPLHYRHNQEEKPRSSYKQMVALEIKKKSNKMQHYTVYLFLENCSTCFGRYLHPSSGAHITVFTVSGTCETVTARGRVGTGLSVVWELY